MAQKLENVGQMSRKAIVHYLRDIADSADDELNGTNQTKGGASNVGTKSQEAMPGKQEGNDIFSQLQALDLSENSTEEIAPLISFAYETIAVLNSDLDTDQIQYMLLPLVISRPVMSGSGRRGRHAGGGAFNFIFACFNMNHMKNQRVDAPSRYPARYPVSTVHPCDNLAQPFQQCQQSGIPPLHAIEVIQQAERRVQDIGDRINEIINRISASQEKIQDSLRTFCDRRFKDIFNPHGIRKDGLGGQIDAFRMEAYLLFLKGSFLCIADKLNEIQFTGIVSIFSKIPIDNAIHLIMIERDSGMFKVKYNKEDLTYSDLTPSTYCLVHDTTSLIVPEKLNVDYLMAAEKVFPPSSSKVQETIVQQQKQFKEFMAGVNELIRYGNLYMITPPKRYEDKATPSLEKTKAPLDPIKIQTDLGEFVSSLVIYR